MEINVFYDIMRIFVWLPATSRLFSNLKLC